MAADRDTREKRVRNIARRLLGEDAEERSIREIVASVVETGDKAKTEAVRLVAREVRTYLDELRVMDDLRELLTSHSLEVQASFHLKPLNPGAHARSEPRAARAEPEPPPADPPPATPGPTPEPSGS